METQTTTISTNKQNKQPSSKDVDWELVDDFKQGLEELKQGKVIRC